MSRQSIVTSLICAALAVFALSATACDNLPISLAPATSTLVPTAAPTLAPQATATPAAPQGTGANRQKAAQALQGLFKSAGLQGGVVTSISGSTLNVKFGKTTAQWQLASDAIIVVPAKANATVSDIRVGDRVVADVTGADANAPVAFLLDFPAGYTAANVMLGAVRSSKGGTLNLRTPRGARDLTTGASTVIVNVSGDQPVVGSLSDLNPASAVLVIGSSGGNAFSAQAIVLLDKDARDLLRKANPRSAPAATPTPGA